MNKENMPIEVWKFLPIKKSVIMLVFEKNGAVGNNYIGTLN